MSPSLLNRALLAKPRTLGRARVLARAEQIGLVSIQIVLLQALGCAVAQPPTTVQQQRDSKLLQLSKFVGDVDEDIVPPLTVVIPANYEKVSLPDISPDYSYWMPPDQVETVIKSGDLPTSTGFFYSKISLDVGYDTERKIFIGFEDRDPAAEMRQALGDVDFKWKRTNFRGYPVILTSFRNPTRETVHYNAYIATLQESLTFYISYTPPDGDPSQGANTWNRFVSALEHGEE